MYYQTITRVIQNNIDLKRVFYQYFGGLMEFDKNTPIYIQIMFEIKRRISTGQLKPGDKLSSVRDLADELKVNPNTIVRAYQELEREGVTETRRGMGTFIIENEKNSINEMKNTIGKTFVDEFIKKMKEAGVSNEEIISLVKEAIGEC